MQSAASVTLGSQPPCSSAAPWSTAWAVTDEVAGACWQPKVTDAKQGWLSLPHMHKSRLDFPEPDIQAVKRGFLPSMSAVSPYRPMLRHEPTAASSLWLVSL
ncbi:hypothetical protein PGA1_c00170 [Phaeobacter inhibens DSM 17395]|nr:hypothetical protein PGA1_c00170 [Phaeobacter inhibens DSM 17395]